MKMGGGENKQSAVDQKKKHKTITSVWRPVCTQAISKEECMEKDVIVEPEDGDQVLEVLCSTSSNVSNVQHVIKAADAVTEATDSTISCSALQGSSDDIVLEGESELSKHSVSIKSLHEFFNSIAHWTPVKIVALHFGVLVTGNAEWIHAFGKAAVTNEIKSFHNLSDLAHVGASLIRFVQGKGGSTQKKIEDEMGVRIIIPSSKKDDSIIIAGDSMDGITRASEKIQKIIDEAVKSPNLDYSHFISLPLAIHPELVDKLLNFQNSLLGNDDGCLDDNQGSNSNEDGDRKLNKRVDVAVELKADDDTERVNVNITKIPLVSYPPTASKSSHLSDLVIDKSIFIKPKTFHLTVLMLKLWNKDRVNEAAEVLQRISSKVMNALDNRPVAIRIKGLDCMKGSLAKARVLYAPVEEIGSEGRLLRACQVIIDAYTEAGLVLEKDANHKLKLHATVMNARHRKRNKWTRSEPDSFDARGIFKQYGSEEWGEYLIREAHLSQRFAFDENGYYHCCASMPFPENIQVD